MTNEQLVELIGTGDNDEFIPLLWERMKKLYRMWADSYYVRYKDRCRLCGVTADDLRQEGYLSMLKAIKAYTNRPEEHKDTLFTSFCKFPFKNHANELIGMRTVHSRNEPLNCSHSSLDEPLDDSNGETSATIGDLIPDQKAEEPFREIEQSDYCRAVRETVSTTLTDKPKELEVIERLYYNNETLSAAGKAMGITPERVRQLKGRAFWHLRNCRELQKLAETNYYIHVSTKSHSLNGSAVEQIVERNERLLYAIRNKYELIQRGAKI